MKQLIWKLILPLTIISFATFTKWWYALVEDGPDEIFSGFPLPFICRGWHTSLSSQIFIAELLFDFLVYFSFWFLVVLFINHFAVSFILSKVLTFLILSLTGLVLISSISIVSNTDTIYYLNRPFKIKILETGYKFIWNEQERSDFYKYYPEDKQIML